MKVTLLAELKKKYGSKSIAEIESEIDKEGFMSNMAQIQRVKMLFYLESTKRFRENKRYVNASFEQYLEDRYNKRPGTYWKEVHAVFGNPDAVKALGIGVVAKIQRDCGEKSDVALDEIKKEGHRKAHGLNREQIQKIIDKHKKPPVPPRPKAKVWTQKEYDALLAHDRHLQAIVKGRDEQISKLGKALKGRDEQISKLGKALDEARQEAAEWKTRYKTLARKIQDLDLGPEDERVEGKQIQT